MTGPLNGVFYFGVRDGSEAMKSLETTDRTSTETGAPKDQRVLEIGPGRPRWRGLFAWLVFYAALAVALVVLFVRFTASIAWAVALVGFILAYVTIVGRLAGGDADRRD